MDKQHQQGFSLIELVVVIVIMGIAAAYVGVKWSSSGSLHAQAEQLARDIRHTQAIAMSQNMRLQLAVSGATYAVTNSGSPIADPSGSGNFNETLRDGVSASGGPIVFDSWGRPLNGSNLASSSISFTVTSGSNSSTVTVQPITGYVSVSP